MYQIDTNNSVNGMTALMNLQTNTDYIVFEVAGKRSQIRVAGTYETPWFNGLDVCAILEYKNQQKALQDHVKHKYKKSLGELSSEMPTVLGGDSLGSGNLTKEYHAGKAIYINESGFYRLVLKSKARLAEAFQELVCDYVLPTLRRHGTVSVEGMQKQLEDLRLENETKTKDLEEAQAVAEQERLKAEQAQAAALEAQDKAARAERSAKWNKTMMKNVRIREKKMEWIYIATTRDYAKQRVFKIGSTKRLSKRLSGYQTGRLKKDEYYYAWYLKVYHAEELDHTIQKILDEFKHQKSKEMYQSIKFKDLKEIVNYICVNYDKSIEFLNDFVKNRLPISYEEEDTEDDIPPPISPEVIIRLNNEQEELFDVTAVIKDLMHEYLGGIETASKGSKDDPIMVHREDLMKMIREGLEEEIGIRSAWHTVKNLIAWKSSKTPIEYEGRVYNIHYRAIKET
jgi:prophage antirepressor-like protein